MTNRRKAPVGTVTSLVGIGAIVVVGVVVGTVYLVSDLLRAPRFLGGSDAAITLVLDDAVPGEVIEVQVSGGETASSVLVGGEAAPAVLDVVLQPNGHALNSYGSAVNIYIGFSSPVELEVECEGPVELDLLGRIVAPSDWPSDADIEATCRLRRVPKS